MNRLGYSTTTKDLIRFLAGSMMFLFIFSCFCPDLLILEIRVPILFNVGHLIAYNFMWISLLSYLWLLGPFLELGLILIISGIEWFVRRNSIFIDVKKE